MHECVITLVKHTKTANGADIIETEKDRYDLMATEKSVGMRETYQALSVGLKPEKVFIISDYLDYEDQKILIFEEEKYEIIRTYKKDDNQLEITVTR